MLHRQAVWLLISQCKCNIVHLSSDLRNLFKVTLYAVTSKCLSLYHAIYNYLRVLRRALALRLDFVNVISMSLHKTSERFFTRHRVVVTLIHSFYCRLLNFTSMSSDRDAVYYPPPPPPPPPLLPLLFNDLPQFSSTCTLIPLHTNCAVVNVLPCTCRRNPEQELLDTRNRLWQYEGTPDPPHVSYYRYIEPVLQDGPK